MANKFTISNYLAAHVALSQKLDIGSMQKGVDIIKEAFDNGKKIMTCGNGGSASTASHYITDWNKMVNLSTGKKFRGICLCDNIGLVTAFGNDISYDDIYSGQINALMDKDDLLVAVSGSGNSPNIVKAIDAARECGGRILGIVGYDGGKVKTISDHSVWVDSFDMQLCEDVHLMFGHMVMKEICGSVIK